jgi:acyl-CoA synthetase (AMP-forming)/AMP-acid ligase II
VPTIPKTGAGKFLKSAIREQYREHYSSAAAANPVVERVT